MRAAVFPKDILSVPSGWRVERLADTAHPGKASFIDGDWIEAPYITDEGIRLIQTGNIGLGTFIDRAEFRKFISERSFRELECKWVYPGDILICRLADPIGRACILPTEIGPCVTAVDCTIYRPNTDKVDSTFAVQLFNSESHLRRVADVAGGSTRQRISRSNLGNIHLLLPPLPEQRRIAEILDTADAAIQQTQAFIAKLKQMKAGLLHDLLTRGLDRGNQFAVSDVARVLPGGTPSRSVPEYWGGSIRWASARDVASCSTRYLKDTAETITLAGVQNSSTRLLPKEAILITQYRKICYGPLVAGSATQRLTNFAS
jgi:restriction endonuclease S subunit